MYCSRPTTPRWLKDSPKKPQPTQPRVATPRAGAAHRAAGGVGGVGSAGGVGGVGSAGGAVAGAFTSLRAPSHNSARSCSSGTDGWSSFCLPPPAIALSSSHACGTIVAAGHGQTSKALSGAEPCSLPVKIQADTGPLLASDKMLSGAGPYVSSVEMLSGAGRSLPRDEMLSGTGASLASDEMLSGTGPFLPSDEMLSGFGPSLPSDERQSGAGASLASDEMQSGAGPYLASGKMLSGAERSFPPIEMLSGAGPNLSPDETLPGAGPSLPSDETLAAAGFPGLSGGTYMRSDAGLRLRGELADSISNPRALAGSDSSPRADASELRSCTTHFRHVRFSGDALPHAARSSTQAPTRGRRASGGLVPLNLPQAASTGLGVTLVESSLTFATAQAAAGPMTRPVGATAESWLKARTLTTEVAQDAVFFSRQARTVQSALRCVTASSKLEAKQSGRDSAATPRATFAGIRNADPAATRHLDGASSAPSRAAVQEVVNSGRNALLEVKSERRAQQRPVTRGSSRHFIPISQTLSRGDAAYVRGMQLSDGGRYDGELRHGVPDGHGVRYTSRSRHIGQFRHGLPNGWGVKTRPDRRLEGMFRDGRLEGLGVQIWNAGRYEGMFREGLPDGQGVCVLDKGVRYEDGFRNGKYDGQGKRVSGEITYEGGFRDGCEHGLGTMRWSDGEQLTGVWEVGHLLTEIEHRPAKKSVSETSKALAVEVTPA